MRTEIKIEILSQLRTLLGFSYMKGYNMIEEKQIIFHEVGIGFVFFGIFITFYK